MIPQNYINDRKKVIQDIISDLESLNDKVSDNDKYALNENIIFFKSIESITKYIKWFLFRLHRIEAKRLLELTDFPLEKWEEELQNELIEMERRKFPGLITPLVNKIFNFISKKNIKILLDLGCGGMEVERQVISRLLDTNYNNEVVFIGIDKSKIAHRIAKQNLKSIKSHINIYELQEVNADNLHGILSKDRDIKYKVILCRNDIFLLNKMFKPLFFDLIFFSKFKHHLNERQKSTLEKITLSLGKIIIEYDDYRSIFHLIPQSIATWKYPPLMNGAIFSRLRDPTKKDLARLSKNKWKIEIFRKIGSYLGLYISNLNS